MSDSNAIYFAQLFVNFESFPEDAVNSSGAIQ